MTKRAQAKYKIDRRMGENIWGRPRSPFNKREYGPGQHGQRRKGKATELGTQLKAKQKVKGYYGNISERQFHKYYVEAIRMKGDSSANLIGLLERRLDAVIYRAKFVPTVFAARQFVNHGHITVNGAPCQHRLLSGESRRRDRGRRKNRSSSHWWWKRRRWPSAMSPITSRSTRPRPQLSSPASSEPHRGPLSDPYGAEPRHRVLLALICRSRIGFRGRAKKARSFHAGRASGRVGGRRT